MNALTMFNLTDDTKALILNAENSKSDAAMRGVKALTELALDNAMHTFRHGDAAKLADILKHSGLKSAVAKFYAEKTASIVNWAQGRALLAVKGMAKGEEKSLAFSEAMTAAISDLATLKSVSAVMAKIRPAKDTSEAAKVEPEAAKVEPEAAKVELIDLSKLAPFFDLLAMFAAGIHSANIAQAMAAKVPAAKKPTAKKEKIAA